MATETASQAGEAAHGAAEAVGSCVNAHGGAVGMPQLCGDWMGNQIFWLIVTLVVIYLILARVALPRIAAILAERRGTIANDLAEAEKLKARAVEAEEAYNQALADARAEAHRIAAEAKAEIQAELNEAIEKADAEIAARTAESQKAIAEIRASAMESIREIAIDTAGALVVALGGTPDADAVSAAVNDRMKG